MRSTIPSNPSENKAFPPAEARDGQNSQFVQSSLTSAQVPRPTRETGIFKLFKLRRPQNTPLKFSEVLPIPSKDPVIQNYDSGVAKIEMVAQKPPGPNPEVIVREPPKLMKQLSKLSESLVLRKLRKEPSLSNYAKTNPRLQANILRFQKTVTTMINGSKYDTSDTGTCQKKTTTT